MKRVIFPAMVFLFPAIVFLAVAIGGEATPEAGPRIWGQPRDDRPANGPRAGPGGAIAGARLAELASAGPLAAAESARRGRISGVVVEAHGGEPIGGAYVGIGDFGDAGGSNLDRFEKQGMYAHTETYEDGRFVLRNVAFAEHPLVVTHPEFVRFDGAAVVRKDSPQQEVRVEMRPAAKIHVSVVDRGGNPVAEPCVIRLETLDGRAFIPPGRQRHLSAFASPAWTERTTPGSFCFSELEEGEYSVDVMRAAPASLTYYGGIGSVAVKAGGRRDVRVRPTDHGTRVTLKSPKLPSDPPQNPAVILVSRNAGLLVWNDRLRHSLEDSRLGRICSQALLYWRTSGEGPCEFRNLPPGTYAVFAGPAGSLQGIKVELAQGEHVRAEIPWTTPDRMARVGTWRLKRRLRLQGRAYTAEELCRRLTARTESRPAFRAGPAIGGETVELGAAERSIWEILERIHLQKGWRIEEGDETLVLLPAATAGQRENRPAPAAEGAIRGKVLDADGAAVAGACVVLCRQPGGVPLAHGAEQTLAEAAMAGSQPGKVAFCLTDEHGRLLFQGIPPGEYRLVAQSWEEAESIQDPLEVNGETVTLHGVAEHVRVCGATPAEVVLRPLGTGVLSIDEEMPNDATLLVISTAPPRADPILGFAGWGGPFMQNMIGGNRMPKGATTVRGLPEGTVHLALFAADDVPGWGAGRAEIRANGTTEVYVPLVAGWSNGQHDPPERLRELFEEVRRLIVKKDLALIPFLEGCGIRWSREAGGMWAFEQQICPHLSKPIELPGGRKATFGDFMAAVKYVELQQYRKRIDERQARRRELQRVTASLPEVEKAGSQPGGYAEALLDLYRQLGENYPCFELKGIDWKAVGDELLPRVEEVKDDEGFGLLCMELVARLEDSHAHLSQGTTRPPVPPFPRYDPGFACLIDDRDQPVVYYLDPQGPAEQAGLEVGMRVVSVDGKPAGQALRQCMQEARKYQGFSSRRYLRYQAARWFVRRTKRRTIVSLTMLGPDAKTHRFEIPATLDVRYLPRLPVPIPGIPDAGNVSWTRLEGGIGYVYVRRIRGDLIERLDRAVEELLDAPGLIIDVRGNSGGGFDARRAHLNFTLDDQTEPQRPRFQGPLALLIDARCISAGEGWASWFIANRRARVFGETTAGASSRKQTYTLRNGLFRVTYPVKAYRGFLQRPIERRGLEPDVPLMPNARDLAAGRDTVLEAAKAYVVKALRSPGGAE